MGIHGRDSIVRVCGLVATGVLLSCAVVVAQPVASPDLLQPLADKIAASVAANTQIALTLASATDADRATERELVRLLAARGLRVVAADAPGAVPIAAGCGQNLRERTCVAEIRRAGTREIVTAVAPHATASLDRARHPVALELTPLFAQRAPILDVLLVDDRLIVLDPASITIYRRDRDTWQPVSAHAIEPPRTWPRDVRGRLRLAGSALEAFLPGVVCRSSLELTSLSCADQREPWPLAIDNAGLDALRNTFQTPEGTPFFSAAALESSAGAPAVMVTSAHALVLVDDSRTAIATIGGADDVASVAAGCGGGAHVVTAVGTPGAGADALHLVRVDARTATAAATPIVVSGRVTALWSSPGATAATVVVRDPNVERHEAFQLRLSCQ